MMNFEALLQPVLALHEQIRTAVVAACETASVEAMAAIAHEAEGDTIYAIDRVSEERLRAWVEAEIAVHTPVVLIAEGLAEGELVLPVGAAEQDAVWRIIVDPIDGTRGLMYQKRSAWILTGVAPNRGAATNLQDIVLAVQTEIPLVKQHLCDQVWAVRGEGATAVRHNRLTGETTPLPLRPSGMGSIAHGFAMIARFFAGGRDVMAAIDDEIVLGALGPAQPGKAHCFEDQYICVAGQLYELMSGRDRFVADIRPLLQQLLVQRGLNPVICCHPYDLCTELIAREMGVIVTDAYGAPLAAPLNLEADVSWAGYANPVIQAQIEPLFQAALRRRGL